MTGDVHGGVVRVWNLDTRKVAAEFQGAIDDVTSLSFDAKCRWLAAASDEGRLTLRATEITSYRSNTRYSPQETGRKEEVVLGPLTAAKPRNVLDIGCNTGRFGLLAAKNGVRVVAIDRDESAVGELWKFALSRNADILPIVIDISRPPRASGWANREYPAFLDRAPRTLRLCPDVGAPTSLARR